MNIEKLKCPLCGLKLYERHEGFVCKNWKCELYHKKSRGWVLMTGKELWSKKRKIINGLFNSSHRLQFQKKWIEKKQEILIRDDYTCLKCGYDFSGGS